MAKHPLALLPAVTIADGSSRLAPAGYGPATDTGTPADAIASWEAQGAAWIHLVDLDATKGAPPNLGQVVASGAQVQYEGAIRDDASLSAALAIGAARLVVDPTDLDWTTAALAEHGDRLAVGVDIRDPELIGLVRVLERAGCRRIVVSNPAEPQWKHDRQLLEELCAATNVPLTTRGGVTHLSDLHLLHEFVPLGVDAIVIDDGLYDGDFTFSEAIAASSDRFDVFYWGTPG